MKKISLMVLILSLTLIVTYSFSQMSGMIGEQKGGMKQQGMTVGGDIIKQEMMQMMMEMMNMQEKMIMGVRADEKKQMMTDVAQMKEKMQKMMSMGTGMMMGIYESQSRLKCAEQWIAKKGDKPT